MSPSVDAVSALRRDVSRIFSPRDPCSHAAAPPPQEGTHRCALQSFLDLWVSMTQQNFNDTHLMFSLCVFFRVGVATMAPLQKERVVLGCFKGLPAACGRFNLRHPQLRNKEVNSENGSVGRSRDGRVLLKLSNWGGGGGGNTPLSC